MTGRSGHIDWTLDLSVRSPDDGHVSLYIQPKPPDLNGHDMTGRSGTSDRTLKPQRPIVYSKLLETHFFDRTCPVTLDRT